MSSRGCKNQENVESNNFRGNFTECSFTIHISGNKYEGTTEVVIETARTTTTRRTTKTTTTTTTTTTTRATKVESVNQTDVLPGTVEADVVTSGKKRCSLIQDASERIKKF